MKRQPRNPTDALHAPLSGATVLVTRPAGTAAPFARVVRSLGGEAVLLPGLRLVAIDTKIARAALRAVRSYETWVFTSPAAVRHAFAAWPALRLPRRAVAIAVGDGTRSALARHAIEASTPAHADSEGVLALPELAAVRGRSIALVGAPGGRDLIAPALRRRGATVDAIHVYERAAPRLTRRHFADLEGAPDPLITVLSSGEALSNLCTLLPPALLARLRRQALVVSSDRLAEMACESDFDDVTIALSALPADLLAAAGRRLARHRL
jgi:uroporphyrinogen-III synthase